MVEARRTYTTELFPDGVRVRSLRPDPQGGEWDYLSHAGAIRRCLRASYARELEGPDGPLEPGYVDEYFLNPNSPGESDAEMTERMVGATRRQGAVYFVAQTFSQREKSLKVVTEPIAIGRSSRSKSKLSHWPLPFMSSTQPNCFINDIALGKLPDLTSEVQCEAAVELGAMIMHRMIAPFGKEREVLQAVCAHDKRRVEWLTSLHFVMKHEISPLHIGEFDLPQDLYGEVTVGELTELLEEQHPSFKNAQQ